MNINAFYSYTLFEIKTYLNAKIEKENEDYKNKCILVYREADLIGASVSRLFSKKAKYPSIEKAFPGIFDDDKTNDPVEKFKADMTKLAVEHNQRQEAMKKGKSIDDQINEARELAKKYGVSLGNDIPKGIKPEDVAMFRLELQKQKDKEKLEKLLVTGNPNKNNGNS